MATQQDVIKAFMRSLDNSTLSGANALDEAIRNCSNGKFSDMQNLIDSFIRDVTKYSGSYSYDTKTTEFLRNYCGIILDNTDTGAISGSDAGGTTTKTAESIVPETGTTANVAKFPSGGKTTINGLTFIWPDRNSLTTDEQAIADRIYTWWAKGALNLIQESYGLNFQESGTSVKEITVKFYSDSTDSALASVNHSYSLYTGKASKLTLNVNMYYYSGFNQQDVNGASNNYSAGYLDRTLAHEFVHAVMAANIDHFHNLPLFVKEGLAELIHGIDDERTSSIRQLASTSFVSELSQLFSIRGTYYNYGSHTYAGGYMLFRYLAKQAATETSTPIRLPAGVTYNANKTTVSILAPFTGTWDSKDYAATVRTIDASQNTKPITIKAGSYNNTIKAGKNGSNIYGQGGSDTIYGGNGKDVFWYGSGDGADTIDNFQSGKDILRFYNKAQLGSVTTAGTTVTLKIGSGSVKLAGKTNQRVDITDTAGKNAIYYFGRQDKANTFVYGANQRYYGSTQYKDILQVNTGATVSLANTTLYHDIDTLDATRSKAAVKLTGGAKGTTLYGSALNDTLTAGSGGASLYGGKGNDTLYGGNGTDRFYWGSGLGNYIVYNYQSNKDIIAFTAGSLKSGRASGSDVILTSNTGNTITLKNAADKTIVIADTKGKLTRTSYLPAGVTYNTNKTAVTIKAPYSGTWDAANFATTVRTVDASQDTNPITIKAGSYNSTIKAGKNGSNIYGQGGNDTIYGGNGKDVFWYGTGDGADTISSYQSGKDVLRFYNKAQLGSVTTSGTNVVLRAGSGSITLLGKANQRVDITDTAGKNAIYYFGRQDKANTFVYGANQRYYGSTKYNDTLQVNTGATVSLANTTLYHDIDTLDATRSKAAVKLTGGTKAATLYGSALNDTLTAGSGGASLYGGKGNDTMYGGNGTDRFYWGSGLGNDIVYNYQSNKDIIAFTAGSLKSARSSGWDVILTSNTGNTITLKNAATKTIVIADTKGKLTRTSYLPAGVTYNTNKTAVTIKAPYTGTWDAANFASTVRTVDASQDTNPITIKAGSYNSTIKAGKNGSNIYGQGGNDTIYGGNGKDVFWYGTGDGADTISGYQSGKDVLRFYNKAQLGGVTTSGTNVVLRAGSGSITLLGKANQRVDITDTAGKNATYYFGRQDKANTFVYGANQRYYGSTKYNDTLQVNTGATVSLANTTLYHDIDTLDATRSKAAVKLTGGTKAATLYGSALNDTLTAGSGGASLYGGKGNDALYGGNGTDRFYWGSGLGNDTIYNYTNGKDTIIFSAGSLKSGKVSGQDVILTSNAGNTLTIKKAAGKAITIQGTDGKKLTKTYSAPTTTSLPSGVTYNSQTMTVKLTTGTVTDFSLSGNDVILKSTVGNIRIANAKDKILSVIYGNGVKATYKVVDDIPTTSNIAYNNSRKEVVLGKKTPSTLTSIVLSGYSSQATTLNGTAYQSNYIYFVGSNKNDTLIAGNGHTSLFGGYGNDKLYGGNGKNIFYWSNYYGNDIIYNYTKGQDNISLFEGRIEGYTVSGNDVILKSGTATLTVKDIKPKDITVYTSSNIKDTYWYDKKLPVGVTCNNATNTFFLTNAYSAYSFNLSTYPSIAQNVDARKAAAPYRFTLSGDDRNNILYASNSGSSIFTGRGKDTVYLGKGKDTLYWYSYTDDKVVYNYTKGQDKIYFTGSYTYYTSGNDLVLKTTNSTLTLKNTKITDVTIGNIYNSAPLTTNKTSLNYQCDVLAVNTKQQASTASLMPITSQNHNDYLSMSQKLTLAQSGKNKLTV